MKPLLLAMVLVLLPFTAVLASNDLTYNPVYFACPLKPLHKHKRCQHLVARLAKELGGTLPDCPAPATLRQASPGLDSQGNPPDPCVQCRTMCPEPPVLDSCPQP